MIALSVSMLGGLASLISSVVAPETVYLVLVSVAGFAVVGVWMSITASHFFHRRSFVKNGGNVAALSYRAPLYPLVPILAFSLCFISLIGIAFDPNQVAALYFGIPFVGACYAFFYFKYGRGARTAELS
jgi:S-methylmethionine transporter